MSLQHANPIFSPRNKSVPRKREQTNERWVANHNHNAITVHLTQGWLVARYTFNIVSLRWPQMTAFNAVVRTFLEQSGKMSFGRKKGRKGIAFSFFRLERWDF